MDRLKDSLWTAKHSSPDLIRQGASGAHAGHNPFNSFAHRLGQPAGADQTLFDERDFAVRHVARFPQALNIGNIVLEVERHIDLVRCTLGGGLQAQSV